MPCGCKENPKYDMEFIGWKDGRLIKGAPKLPKGTIQKNFLPEASLPHWRLIEPVPEVKKVPKAKKKESVFAEDDETPEESKLETKPYKCSICGNTFKTERGFENHKKNKHPAHYPELAGEEKDEKPEE